MKVKSYIVENREEYINQLEKELCQLGISYVKIDYEFHFLDQIIRFYDYELDKLLIIRSFFINEEEKKNKNLIETLMKIEANDRLSKKYNSKDWIQEIDYSDIKSSKPTYQKRTKSFQKQESIKVNQKLKRYK